MAPTSTTSKPATGAKSSSRTRSKTSKSPAEKVAPAAPKPTDAEKARTERAQEVPARAEQTQTDPEASAKAQADAQENAAKEAEELRDKQLQDGKGAAGGQDFSELTVPEQRAGGQKGTKPSEGRVDNMTRRHDAEPLQGHFVNIDLSNADAKKGVEAVIGEGQARFGNGDYGVYDRPGELDDDGYPVTALVLLRDANAALVVVPYAALSHADAGRR